MSLPIGNRVQAFTWLLNEAPLSLEEPETPITRVTVLPLAFWAFSLKLRAVNRST